MRLKYQFFLVLLLASAVLIALMAGVARWSFDRGFLDYVAEVERQRLEPLSEALAGGYARNGDWLWVTADGERAWRTLMQDHVVQRRRGRPDGARHAEGPERSRPRPPRPGNDLVTLDPRLLLADAARDVLIGRADRARSVRWQPIQVDGEAVGHLGHRAVKAAPGSIDEVFAAQQRRGFTYAALTMVLLCALMAMITAPRLLRPLLGVTEAVKRIGRGEYAYRVPAVRRDEIGDLARDVNRLAATLETSLAARRRWLAEISHELRTPVAILRGELEAIQDGIQPLDQAAVASLHAESLRLSRLIEDLHALTLSDAGALDYRFETVDLHTVLAERLEAGRAGAAERSIDIELSSSTGPLSVRGDRQRLGQLIDNLLQNSLRYTDPGGKIRVDPRRDAGFAIIDWYDSAPAVGAEHLPRLFDPLYRVDDSRHRDRGGAGLGLAIVARIVEAHDGHVSAHPSSLGGLTLRIALPTDTGIAS